MSAQDTQRDLDEAIRYALRCGCLFEYTQEPRPPYRTEDLIKWGAMRNLHRAIAERFREQRP
jgi:hypothetical protein